MKHDLKHYSERLEAERKIVTGDLGSVSIHTGAKDKDDWEAVPVEGTDSADPNNVADRLSGYENNDAIVRDMESRLREIDHALNKIKAHTFGFCEVCEKEIEEDRLEANPAARTCKEHINTKLGTPEIQ